MNTLKIQAASEEINKGERFGFGENWSKYARSIDDSKIKKARTYLAKMLKRDNLTSFTFIDVGSGSGLMSLAAYQLGADVHSFDYDPQSVDTTSYLKSKHAPDDNRWKVESGSVLDDDYIESIGKFDIVYSWGVLHHTGYMDKALANTEKLIKEKGLFYIALYNDQGFKSKIWHFIKKLYCRSNKFFKKIIVALTFIRLWGPTVIKDTFKLNPLKTWSEYKKANFRGMDPWYDVIDWVGGYPFEVASFNRIQKMYESKGFKLISKLDCNNGLGCNEFVFERTK